MIKVADYWSPSQPVMLWWWSASTTVGRRSFKAWTSSLSSAVLESSCFKSLLSYLFNELLALSVSMQNVNKLPVVWWFHFLRIRMLWKQTDVGRFFRMFCKITHSQMSVLVVLTPELQELRSSEASGLSLSPSETCWGQLCAVLKVLGSSSEEQEGDMYCCSDGSDGEKVRKSSWVVIRTHTWFRSDWFYRTETWSGSRCLTRL